MHENAGKVMTVLGLIDPKDLGKTLPHEHTTCNLQYYAEPSKDPEGAKYFKDHITLENLHFLHGNPYAIYENCICQDCDLIVRELQKYKNNGGGSICELGPLMKQEGADFVKDEKGNYKVVSDLKHWHDVVDISKRSGVHIISSIGLYLEMAHPDAVKEMTAEQLADSFIDVIRNGYGDTGIKPGIIGETGVGPVCTNEEIKALRAMGIAQRETGLGVNIHVEPYTYEYDFRILDTLEEVGCDLTRVVLSHREACLTNRNLTFDKAVDHYVGICDRGASVEFDTCGDNDEFYTDYATWDNPSDYDRAKAVHDLCMRGHAKRVFLSHDLAHRYLMTEFGGNGYSHVITTFRKLCMKYGVTEYDLDTIMIENPKRLLTIK